MPLDWQVATDSAFASVVSSGKVDALEANGFTAKVDATGLRAGTNYFYRFRDALGTASTVGTTRTLPAADAASVKFAVFSCSLYSEGFFNSYADAARSDALYAVHLGDYIYEYDSDPAKYGNRDAVALGRVVVPTNDIVNFLTTVPAMRCTVRTSICRRCMPGCPGSPCGTTMNLPTMLTPTAQKTTTRLHKATGIPARRLLPAFITSGCRYARPTPQTY